jgi:hypothetical protein
VVNHAVQCQDGLAGSLRVLDGCLQQHSSDKRGGSRTVLTEPAMTKGQQFCAKTSSRCAHMHVVRST